MAAKKIVNVCGDTLEVSYDGNQWVSPHNGQQHTRAAHAMRSELVAYFRASGEDTDDEAVEEQIEGLLEDMEDADEVETHECASCGKCCPVADDETDPAGDEVAVDSRGLVEANRYVCGECLTAAEDALAE